MKLTKDQVEEICKIIDKEYNADFMTRRNHVIDDIKDRIRESFIEKEYKCHVCGNALNSIFECDNPKHDGDMKNWACYKDDWNGGVV